MAATTTTPEQQSEESQYPGARLVHRVPAFLCSISSDLASRESLWLWASGRRNQRLKNLALGRLRHPAQ
jgi:hypothetical protein